MHEIVKASTDQSIDIFIQDSSSTIGAGLPAIVFNSAGLTCYYRRGATGTVTVLPLVTQTVGGAHADGGFVQLDATNASGMYRLDLSDAIVATGVDRVTLYLKGAANMAPVTVGIRLVAGVPEVNLTQIDGAAHDLGPLLVQAATAHFVGMRDVDAANISMVFDGAILAGSSFGVKACTRTLYAVTEVQVGILGSTGWTTDAGYLNGSCTWLSITPSFAGGAIPAGLLTLTYLDGAGSSNVLRFAYDGGKRYWIPLANGSISRWPDNLTPTTTVPGTVDTMAELSQGIPPVNPNITQALMFLYMALRNKRYTTATIDEIYNDAGVVIAKAPIGDDGSTTTKARYGSGP